MDALQFSKPLTEAILYGSLGLVAVAILGLLLLLLRDTIKKRIW
jgi:hypothetical protein